MNAVEKKDTIIPVSILWERILLVPISGVLDSQRAQALMEAMLTKISDTDAKIIILDVIGVLTVDTQVANYLIKITEATRLMGCGCIVSGISPQVAQTIVSLGVDLTSVTTTATMKDATILAFRRVGLQVKPQEPARAA